MGCGLSSASGRGFARGATRVRDVARDGRFSEVVVAQRHDDSIHIRLDQEDLWTDCVSSVSAVTSLRSRLYASRSSTVANDDGSVVAALDESIANMADLQDIESSFTLPDSSLALSPTSPCSDVRFPGRAAPATFIDSREHPLAPILQHGCAHSFKSPSRTSCPSPRSGDPGTSSDDPSVRDDVSCTLSATHSIFCCDELSVSTAPPERRPVRHCLRSDDLQRRQKEGDHSVRAAASKRSL